MKTCLVTGGAGFVGSHLCLRLKRDGGTGLRVVAFDNLVRKGSELNVPRLQAAGVDFVKGDVRRMDELKSVGPVNVLLECSAEPSVLAGFSGSPDYVIQTNLVGALNCLEIAREHRSDFVFLSTSRVYPVSNLNSLRRTATPARFAWPARQRVEGISPRGITEAFSLEGNRSLYGATKLCAELILREYSEMYGFRSVIDRCGVISGPWQMGKVDQGVVVLWVAAHLYGFPLSYVGFGGQGKQVRDLLHVEDLCDLVSIQLGHMDRFNGRVYNVGGGAKNSVSLRELTDLCREVTGKTIPIGSVSGTRPADIRCYITDNGKVQKAAGWKPRRDCRRLVRDVADWINGNKEALRPILCPPERTTP